MQRMLHWRLWMRPATYLAVIATVMLPTLAFGQVVSSTSTEAEAAAGKPKKTNIFYTLVQTALRNSNRAKDARYAIWAWDRI